MVGSLPPVFHFRGVPFVWLRFTPLSKVGFTQTKHTDSDIHKVFGFLVGGILSGSEAEWLSTGFAGTLNTREIVASQLFCRHTKRRNNSAAFVRNHSRWVRV